MNTTKLYIFNLFVKLVPPSRCNGMKVRLLRWAGAKVGKNVSSFTPRILGEFDLVIGDNCWIGMNSVVLPGVKLGEKTIVGAGSVITKSYEEGHCIIAGNPAKIIKYLN